MKNAAGETIYIGKAKSLVRRLTWYFRPHYKLDTRIAHMLSETVDFDVFLAESETEALLLENNLVKALRPRFNFKLKDDKSYPCICIKSERFPRLTAARYRESGASQGELYGPYPDAAAVRNALKLLHELLPLRTCNLTLPPRRTVSPCLRHQLGTCGAPCAGRQSEEEYMELIEQARHYLRGRFTALLPFLREQMTAAAAALRYERAAALRRHIETLTKLSEKQKAAVMAAVAPAPEAGHDRQPDLDVLGVAIFGPLSCLLQIEVRQGVIAGRTSHFYKIDSSPAFHDGLTADKLISEFIGRHYAPARSIGLLLPKVIQDRSAIEAAAAQAGLHVTIPTRGDNWRLVKMAMENARLALMEHMELPAVRRELHQRGLAELQRLLGLGLDRVASGRIDGDGGDSGVGGTDRMSEKGGSPEAGPHLRLEVYTLIAAGSTALTGAMIVHQDGDIYPGACRHLRLKTALPSGMPPEPEEAMAASMKEAIEEFITRRFALAEKERKKHNSASAGTAAGGRDKYRWTPIPDCILIIGEGRTLPAPNPSPPRQASATIDHLTAELVRAAVQTLNNLGYKVPVIGVGSLDSLYMPSGSSGSTGPSGHAVPSGSTGPVAAPAGGTLLVLPPHSFLWPLLFGLAGEMKRFNTAYRHGLWKRRRR